MQEAEAMEGLQEKIERGSAMRTLLGASILFASAISLQACSVKPELLTANERGGIIAKTNGTNEAAGFSVADSYCRQHGRLAQITGMDVLYNHMMFACVTP